MAKYAMVVDLQSCTGCSSCITACKRANNVPANIYWCDSEKKYEGKFPMLKYEYLSTRCNHCDDAPCAEVCPTGAMFKEDDGIVNYNREDCISCLLCLNACPYGEISFNDKDPHQFWNDDKATFKGVTATAKEVVDKIGATPPYSGLGTPVRARGLVEKCNFCVDRVRAGGNPACASICPADALIFGDLDDPNSEVSKLLKEHSDYIVRTQKGKTGSRSGAPTGPNVYYIKEYCNLKRATAK